MKVSQIAGSNICIILNIAGYNVMMYIMHKISTVSTEISPNPLSLTAAVLKNCFTLDILDT